MLETLRIALGRLRRKFGRNADDAYVERDEAITTRQESFAAGKADAFATAEDEVRKAQRE